MALHKKTTKPSVHLRNSNKQHLSLTKLFYINNTPFIVNENAKF